jgi:hypothetical protein
LTGKGVIAARDASATLAATTLDGTISSSAFRHFSAPVLSNEYTFARGPQMIIAGVLLEPNPILFLDASPQPLRSRKIMYRDRADAHAIDVPAFFQGFG